MQDLLKMTDEELMWRGLAINGQIARIVKHAEGLDPASDLARAYRVKIHNLSRQLRTIINLVGEPIPDGPFHELVNSFCDGEPYRRKVVDVSRFGRDMPI